MRILITGTVAILIILGLVKTIQDYEMTNDTRLRNDKRHKSSVVRQQR